MTVVDPNDPLMVFDPDGHLLDPTSRLPRDTVWAVHPATRTLSIPDAREVEVHEVVPRWPRWRAALLDVTATTELRLERGRRRIVETTRSATLRGLERVHAAASEDGAELLSQWPTLVLPGSAGGSEWHVTVHVIGGDGRVERQVEVGQHDVALSVGAMAADFAAKSVRVRARGPLGRSLRRDIRVLPDLSVACQPAIRTFVDDGLSPTRVELSGVEDPGFVLNAQELSRRVHLDTKPAIVVEPPSLAVQHVRNAVPTAWRHAPLVIELEELVDEPGHLLVRLPTELQALELRLQDGRGATCQRITHTGPRRRDGAVLFDLARFTDTLRDLGSGTLALGSDVWSGRIASVRPAKLAQLVEPTADGELRIVGVHAQGVSAGVYARLVPTRGPVVFEVPPGDVTLPLPSELADLGQLRVLLRLNDPWAPEPWPTFPAAGRNVHDVERAPDLDALAVAHPLALYLTAAAPLPDLGGYLGDALHIFTLAYQLEAPRAGDNIRAELADQLRARPADVLGAVLSSDLQARELAPTLCMTGLVATLLDPPLPIEDVERLWTRWPGAAVLAVGDHITEDEAGLQFLVERSGPTVQELLDGQTVAALSMPRLDMPALVEWDAPRLHGLRAEAAIVPRVLLDPDSRADDGFQLILALKDANRGERLARVNREAEQLVRYALNRILDPAGAAALAAGVRGRIQGEGWQLLPAASLALCGAARIAARTRNPFGVFNLWSQKALARLAEALPRLVAADLLMAELSLQGGSK